MQTHIVSRLEMMDLHLTEHLTQHDANAFTEFCTLGSNHSYVRLSPQSDDADSANAHLYVVFGSAISEANGFFFKFLRIFRG